MKTVSCRQCGIEFQHNKNRRFVCDTCKKANALALLKKHRAALKLRPGEVSGNNIGSKLSLALRTTEEVAAILHISHQRVQQIERMAFHKLRQDEELRQMFADLTAGKVRVQ